MLPLGPEVDATFLKHETRVIWSMSVGLRAAGMNDRVKAGIVAWVLDILDYSEE